MIIWALLIVQALSNATADKSILDSVTKTVP